MTPRGTDWSLALLVGVLTASGVLTLWGGDRGEVWIYAVHAAAGASLGLLLIWKLRRVGPRLLHPQSWDSRTRFGVLAVAFVFLTLGSGWVWSSLGAIHLAGYTLLAWHTSLGAVLAAIVAAHLFVRAKRPRRRDLASRRQFLEGAAIAVGGIVAWRVQRPLTLLLGLPGADRRFTGSYEAASFEGNAFPTTSWVADSLKPLDLEAFRLAVDGNVARPMQLRLGDLGSRDSLRAILDCTGGFYSEQDWSGVSLGRLIDAVGPASSARYVRVISTTGYRWSFPLDDARRMLLATHVGAEPLTHGHGAPLRLVAPGRRGFQWVKWVTRVELRDESDPGAFPSTILSSFGLA